MWTRFSWALLGALCWFSGALVLGLPMYGLLGTLAWDEDPLVDLPPVELLPVLGLGSLGLLALLGLMWPLLRG